MVGSELVLYIPKGLSSKSSNVITQLAAHFPVLIINKANCQYVVNMHQIDFNDAELNAIFEVDVDDEENHIPELKEGMRIMWTEVVDH